MRKSLFVAVTGVVLAGPMAATMAPWAGAAPGPAREPVKAYANTTLLGARALTGLVGSRAALDVGLGVTHATADSAAAPDRRAAADAANFALGVAGRDLPRPAQVAQQALPDHPRATTTGLDLTDTALSGVVRAALLRGSAQARWNDRDGACAGIPISRGATTVADLALLNASLLGRLPVGFDRQSLVALPGTVHSASEVSLRAVPGQRGNAVVSTSSVQVADLTLFAGTPTQVEVRVVSRPTLTAVSTGDAATSRVTYAAPVLDVLRAGERLGRLDADHPSMDVPLLRGLPRELDLGAVRLSLGQFRQSRKGAAVSGTAALLDLRVLPAGRNDALARVVVGEQEVGALAPAGGVDCSPPPGGGTGTPGQPLPPPPPPSAQPRPGTNQDRGVLAATNAATNPVPFILTGGMLLLVGSVLVAAVPRRLRRKGGDAPSV